MHDHFAVIEDATLSGLKLGRLNRNSVGKEAVIEDATLSGLKRRERECEQYCEYWR